MISSSPKGLDENSLSYLLVVADDIVVVGVEVLLILLIFFLLYLYQLWMDTAADSFRLDPIIDIDPEAEICRLDPLDVDALRGGLERLLDLPMRAGDSDCWHLLLLKPCPLIHNRWLYSHDSLFEQGFSKQFQKSAGFRIIRKHC